MIVNWILGFSANDPIIRCLKSSANKSRKVVGSGTLVMDANEVRNSVKFKNDAIKAAEVMRISRSSN